MQGIRVLIGVAQHLPPRPAVAGHWAQGWWGRRRRTRPPLRVGRLGARGGRPLRQRRQDSAADAPQRG